jgi:hypothetical protein
MKSQFLQKLSNILIPDKETDYIDLYNLQNITGWPMFTIVNHDSENNGYFVAEKVDDTSKYSGKDIDYLDLEYSEIIEYNENKIVIDTGGEFQGLHRITIELNDKNELYVKSCDSLPELSDNIEKIIKRHSEDEYDLFLDTLQKVLENQD